MKHHSDYVKLKMNYGKDRCAQPFKSILPIAGRTATGTSSSKATNSEAVKAGDAKDAAEASGVEVSGVEAVEVGGNEEEVAQK